MGNFFKTTIICCLLSIVAMSHANDASSYQKRPQKAFELIKKCFDGSFGNSESEMKKCEAALTGFSAFSTEHENNKKQEFAAYTQQDMTKFWNKNKCEQLVSAGEPGEYKEFMKYNECTMAQKYKTRLENADAWTAYEAEYTKSAQEFASLSLEALKAKTNNGDFCSGSSYKYSRESLEEAKEKFLDGRWALDAECFAFEAAKSAQQQTEFSTRIQQYDDVYNQELAHTQVSDLDGVVLRKKELDNNRISCQLRVLSFGGSKKRSKPQDFMLQTMDEKEVKKRATCHALGDVFDQNIEIFKKPLLDAVHKDDEASTAMMIEYVANHVKKCPSDDGELCATYRSIYEELKDTAIKVKAEKLTKSAAAEIFAQHGCRAVSTIREPADKYWLCNVYGSLK